MNSNGHGNNGRPPALAFKAPGSGIPILGQQFTIDGWFPTIMLRCHCPANATLLLPGGAAAQCPGCKKVYSIQQQPANINLGIGVVTPNAVPVDDLGAVETGGSHG